MAIRDDFLKVEKEIERLENESALEFVPVFLESCSSYFYFRLSVALASGWVTLGFLKFFSLEWAVSLQFLVSWFVGAGVFLCLGYSKKLLSLCLPKGYKFSKVEAAAHNYFVQEEVFSTQKRSGVLILVAELERSVFVLADKGITEKVLASRWAELGHLLASDFAKGNPGENFLKSLQAISAEIAGSFPRSDNDKNELPNKVRTE